MTGRRLWNKQNLEGPFKDRIFLWPEGIRIQEKKIQWEGQTKMPHQASRKYGKRDMVPAITSSLATGGLKPSKEGQLVG